MINQALQKWRSGDKSLGIWSNLPDIHVAKFLARTDADWMCFDLQNGFVFASAGTDISFLREGAIHALSVARGEVDADSE